MFVHATSAPIEEIDPGVKRQVLGFDPALMMVRVEFGKGASGPVHTHPHRQVTFVVSGRFEASLGDDTRLIEAGDCYFVPPGLPHGVLAIEDGILLDVFSPMREEFIRR